MPEENYNERRNHGRHLRKFDGNDYQQDNQDHRSIGDGQRRHGVDWTTLFTRSAFLSFTMWAFVMCAAIFGYKASK